MPQPPWNISISLIVPGTDEPGLVAEVTVMVEIEVSASSTSAFYGYGNDF